MAPDRKAGPVRGAAGKNNTTITRCHLSSISSAYQLDATDYWPRVGGPEFIRAEAARNFCQRMQIKILAQIEDLRRLRREREDHP